MRKSLNILLAFVLVFLGFQTSFFAHESKAASLTVGIKKANITYLKGNITGSAVRYVDYLEDSSGKEVFCLEREKDSPNGQGGFTSSGEMDAGINYIVANFFEMKEKLTGDKNKDYYITQMAIRIYQDGGKDTHLRDSQGNFYNDPEGVISKIIAIVKKAKDSGKEKPSFNNSISVTPTSSEFQLANNKFATADYEVKVNGNLKSYNVSHTGAPANTEVKKTGNKFKLVTDKENIKQKSYNVEIKVTGVFTNSYNFATKYNSSNASVQDVVSYEGYEINQNVNLSKEATATIKALGDLNLIKTDNEGNVLEGVKFEIKDEDGDIVKSAFTNKDGLVTVEDIPIGKYTVLEKEGLTGYIKDSIPRTLNIKTGEVATISFENTKIYGGVKVIKKSNTGNLLSDVEFTVFRKDGQEVTKAKTNSEGIVEFSRLPYGDYYVQETKGPLSHLMDNSKYPFSINEESHNKVFDFEVINKEIIGSLEIQKLDKDTEKPLVNAEFAIYDATGKEVAKGKTNAEGKATFANLPYGKYTYKETVAPEGYVRNETTFSFDIKEDGKIIKQTVTNEEIKGILEIQKVDKETEKPLANTEFTIFDAGGKEVAKGKTNAEGKATFANLLYGKYTYKETVAPEGYVRNEMTFSFEIKEDGKIIKQTVTNKEIKGTLEIQKADKETEKPLANAEFAIYDATGKEVAKGKTNAEGKATFANLSYGKYKFKETAAPEGYIRNETTFSIEIKEDGNVIKQTVTNEKIKGTLEIQKVDKETEKPLANAEFKIFDAIGKEVAKGKTNVEGKATFPNLPYGKYTYKETVAPEGYVQNETIFSFEIKEDGKNIKQTVTNKGIKGTMEIQKIDKETEKPLANAEFAIYDAVGKEVAKGKTNVEGKATFVNLSYGKYTYKETAAPEGYVRNETTFSLEIKEDGKVIKHTVTNKEIKGTLEIQKIDTETEKPLANAEFNIMNEEGKEVASGKTNAEGKATFVNLSYGKYTYKESVAPEGYVRNQTTISFEIKEDGKIIKQTVTNVEVKGTLEIQKVDKETEKPLVDAEFTIYNAGGKEVAKGKTNTEGKATFVNLPYGKYTYKETAAPEGYVRNETTFTFEIREDGKIIKQTVTNKEIKGTLEIQKIDKETEKPLANAEFAIYDATDKEVVNGKTNAEGKVTFANLPYGKYIYKETAAPEGYVQNENTFSFEVTEDGQIIKQTVTNKEIKGILEIQKVDKETKNPLANAAFTIMNEAGKEVIKGKTNKEGKVIFEGIPYGKYTYKETAAPEGYVQNETILNFEIKEDGEVIKQTVTNKQIEGILEITKVDKETGKVLPKAEFTVTKDGKELSRIVTDKEGKATIHLPYGSGYKVVETKAPTNYQLNAKTLEFKITKNNQVVKFKVENSKVPNKTLPQTGDNSNLPYILGGATLLLLGAALFVWNKKRKR
nr:SpaA isopeptide-forming pilin-related protein [Niallia taxi]